MPPSEIHSVDEAETLLSEPTPQLIEMFSRLSGDLLILGAAGKMGPTLARMARRAFDAAGMKNKVIGVSRFSNPAERDKLESWNVQTIQADLLDPAALRELPDAPNIVYMAGMKFGATGNEPLTWAMNTYLAGMVCQRFAGSRIAAFSTGNVYGLTPLALGGSLESDPPNPAGDYAMSCLGRERMFQHFSKTRNTPVTLIRLNYACEVRYGVLTDLARKVWQNETIDLAMGNFGVIWQGDANAMSLMSLAHAASPAFILNVSGPELLSVRRVCARMGRIMDRTVRFEGVESPDALVSNGQLGHRLFGYPRISADRLIEIAARWIMRDGSTLNKPTHFETRSGKY